MSAGDNWHEQAPVRGADPIIAPAILHWLRGQGRSEPFALPWEGDSQDAFRPEPAPDGNPASEDILANLLRAIENTDVAARFQNVASQDSGHPPAANFGEPAETASAASMLREPPPKPNGGCSEPASDISAESHALANLLRAIQSTEVASTLEGIPQTENTEPAAIASTKPSESAETPAALSFEPEIDASAYLPTAAPAEPEVFPSSAVAVHNPQSMDEGLPDDSPAAGDCEQSQVASSDPIECAQSASILEPPVATPDRVRQNPQPRRVSRRRNSNRQRSDYLLSIAAPAIVPPPCAPAGESASTQTAEPLEPAKAAAPLPVIVVTTVPEPERPLTAEPPAVAEAPSLPAATDNFAPQSPAIARIETERKRLAATGEFINVGLDRAEMHLENWFQKWFGPPDPRRSTRVDNPPLAAYHWIVDVPQALKIANISAGGLHLITKDRWSEGNIVSMTLQRTDKEKGSPESWIAVDFLVMRWCEDGMAGAFMPSAPGLAHTVAGRAGNCADRKMLERFVNRLIDATARRAAAAR